MDKPEFSTKNPEAEMPQGSSLGWAAEAERMKKIGEEFMDFGSGLAGLANAESKLAASSFVRLFALTLIIKPVILLTWCSFAVLVAWLTFELSGSVTVALTVFLLEHIMLLFTLRMLMNRYLSRMTWPHTRAQIKSFIRGSPNESTHRNSAS